MKQFFYLSLLMLVVMGVKAQNTGIIAGRILDQESNSSIAGASVRAEGKQIIKLSDVEGRYQFSIEPGEYEIKIESLGFNTKVVSNVIVKAGEVTELNVLMEHQVKQMEAVVVTASARRESISSVLALQKNNASISDGISAEAIKKSPDKNIGEVLKRVSGTSIQDDKFVVVRGLSDRYNIALINGALLPSTEPDRRAFSFDVVPSNLIDNILINKTASPDLPGDFSGGLVQILTKDIPFSNFMNVSMGAGYNSISTGKPFKIGMLENTDYLGFDNGKRLMPSSFPGQKRFASYNLDASPERRLAASRLMYNNYGDRYQQDALPSFNFQFNLGKRKEFNNGGTLGSVLALTYRNTQNVQYNVRRDYQTPDQINLEPGNLFYDYRDTSYAFNTNISLLANFAYKKGNSKFAFKNIANRLFENSNLHRSGYNYDNLQYVNVSGSVPVIKSVISSQLEGEHLMSKRNDRLKWNVNYTLTARNQPDYRVLPYAKNIDDLNDKNVSSKVVLRDTYRFWSDLYDNAFGSNVNYSLPISLFSEKQLLKAGLFGQYKIREFDTRIFRYEQASSTLNPALPVLPAQLIFNDGNIYEEGFVLNEITNNTDQYESQSGLYAGYLMIDGKVGEKWRTVYGVRVESFDFGVNTFNFSGEKVNVSRNYLDILPSVNLTYKLNSKTNLRLSGSQTVSRPEFREVANFAYYDFVRNAQLKGNIHLERSQNTNLDLRFETYPKSGEIISVSAFYKYFRKPIEQNVDPGSTPSNLILSYVNPRSATTMGAELEIRKGLEFLGPDFLSNLSFNLNGALMKSSVEFNSENNPFDPDRPLQGQSPWLVNAGLQYASIDNKISVSALVNRIGHRISAVGFQGYPDIYENGRTVLDLQTAIRILDKKGELKFNFSDLLNQRSVFYQNVDPADNTSYNSGKDRIQYNYLYGRSFSLGFTYNF